MREKAIQSPGLLLLGFGALMVLWVLLSGTGCVFFRGVFSGWDLEIRLASFFYPGCSDENQVAVPSGLAGTWVLSREDGERMVTLTPREDGSCRMVLRWEEEGVHRAFPCRARAFESQGRLLLDAVPEVIREDEDLGRQALFQLLFYVPAHVIFLVEEQGEGPRFKLLNPVWVAEWLDDHPEELPHEKRSGRYLVTASTEAVQAFLKIALEREEDAFTAL